MTKKPSSESRGLLAILLPLIVVGAASAQAVSFDYSSLGNALIEFQGQGTGGTLSITNDPSTALAFQIADANPSTLDGLAGRINGSFAIGSPVTIGPGEQEAAVTGTGTMSIFDGSSVLSATLSWNTIVTLGPFGALNYNFPTTPANLSNFTYSGTTTSPLYQLANATSGTNVLDFTFNTPESISSLIQSGTTNSTTFSGSIEAIPEPSTCALVLGSLAICFAAWQRRRWSMWLDPRST
jgi:hypothetical protein